MLRQGWSGVIAGLALTLAACSSVNSGTSQISGYVMPTAPLASDEPVRIVVSLLDVSKQDVAAEVLAQSSITQSAQWPIAYSLPYDPNQLEPRYTFAVQARVTDSGGTLIAITDTRHQFAGSSDADNFDLLVRNLADPGKLIAEASVLCEEGEFLATFYDQFVVIRESGSQSRRILPRVVAASGSKYQRESEVMWFKGQEATYTNADANSPCTVTTNES